MSIEVTKVGDYRLLSPLGAGGMGEVYYGVSLTADPVAVKVIRPHLVSGDTMRERFAAEVESLKLVYGSRVARLEDADPYADPAWLAVEYIPGLTVKQYVEARGPLPAEIVAMVGAMLADGLSKVHQAGLLHRDLKPQNVILGPSGPVLIDFGLAVLAERGHELTETGVPIGTPAYMAPEQARGDKDLTPAVDIYGLGATLVYALTGHTLYSAATHFALLRRVADSDDLPDMTGVPAELASLIGTMLAFDPSARPGLDAVRSRLLKVATGGGVPIAAMRSRVAEVTYDPTKKLEVPAVLDDPVKDPEVLDDPGAVQPPKPADDPRPDVEREVDVVPRVDVSWLVDKLRHQYARRSTL